MVDPDTPSIADIGEMIALLKEGGWRSATLRLGDFELTVSDGSEPAVAGAPRSEDLSPYTPTPAPGVLLHSRSEPLGSLEEPAKSADLHVVKAETLGAFWRSPQPGAPEFVAVGDEVDADTPLAIIEVMKMMTRITAGVVGKVVAIHVENGYLVELGQPLITIDTSSSAS